MVTNRQDISGATAAFTDAFQFPGQKLSPFAPQSIEDHRLEMATRPGLIRKLLPLREDEHGAYAGGCHLFDTYENAESYRAWSEKEWLLEDGMHFLEHPQYLDPISQLWQIVQVEDFGDVETQQKTMRFERWHLTEQPDMDQLRNLWWPKVKSAAIEAGLTSVWLLVDPNKFHPQLGLVTTADESEIEHRASYAPDVSRLEAMPSLGGELAEHIHGTKVFDRSSWVYMIWFPIEAGNSSPGTALWPCSPPLPGLSVAAVPDAAV